MNAKSKNSFLRLLFSVISPNWQSFLLAVTPIFWTFVLKLIAEKTNGALSAILKTFGQKNFPTTSELANATFWLILEPLTTSFIYWIRPIFEADVMVHVEDLLFVNCIHMDFEQFFKWSAARNSARIYRHSKAITKSASILVFDLLGSIVGLVTAISFLRKELEMKITVCVISSLVIVACVRIVLVAYLKSIRKECIKISEDRAKKLTECFENFLISSITEIYESSQLKKLFESVPKLKYSVISEFLKFQSKIGGVVLCLCVVYGSNDAHKSLIKVIRNVLNASKAMNTLISSYFKLESRRIDLEDLNDIDLNTLWSKHMGISRFPVRMEPNLMDGGKTLVKLDDISIFIQNRIILKNLKLEIRPGEKIALIGRNGSGKTTFLRFFLGFYEFHGSVMIGDHHVIDVATNFLPIITYIPQNTYLNETVLDELFQESVRSEDVLTLAKHAGIDEAIGAHRKGYMTHTSELSESEKQLVKIVKNCACPAPILLADEPLCSLADGLQDRMIDMILGCTLHSAKLVVIHNLSLINKFDKVFKFENHSVTVSTPKEYLEELSNTTRSPV